MQLPAIQRRSGTPLTNDELVDAIVEAQSMHSSDALEKKGQKKAMINLDLVETMLLDEEANDCADELKRAKDRKGTNFVTKQDVEEAARVSFGKADGEETVPVVIAPAPQRKGRKPTGCVTKEQLLSALNEDDDDEEYEDEAGASATPAAAGDPGSRAGPNGIVVGPVPKRRGRKPTGFVSKSKLKKVLQMFGDREKQED